MHVCRMPTKNRKPFRLGCVQKCRKANESKGGNAMRASLLMIVSGLVLAGCYTFGTPSTDYQVTTDEIGQRGPTADSQSVLLFSAYRSGSKDTLDSFFRAWANETARAPSPDMSSPVVRAASSLLSFLQSQDFNYPAYGYKYAMVQNGVSVSIETTDGSGPLTSNITGLLLEFQNTKHAIPLGLDNKHAVMLNDFLGSRTDDKAAAARSFFGALVPIGNDVDPSNAGAWVFVEHWYSFDFSSGLDVAYVQDESPLGSDDFMCELDENGNWMIVMQAPASPPPPVPSPEPPPVPPVIGDPIPPPWWPPEVPIPVGTPVSPEPSSPPAEPARPRPVAPPTHNPSPPDQPTQPRPRPIPPPEHNPSPPADTSSTSRRR